MVNLDILSSEDPAYQHCLFIRRQVFILEQKVPEEIEIDEFENSCDHFLLTSDGKPAATGRLRVKGDKIKFERIATLPEFRGLGVGRDLMEGMTNHARTQYPALIPFMNAQADAIGFYEKLGWECEGDIFFEANIPHRAMRLRYL